MSTISHVSDFDFLVGKWNVLNKRLKDRLSGSEEWIEFTGTLEVRKTLDGLANIDEYKTEVNGKHFEAVTIRLFNPSTELWSIYWMDSFTAELTLQVTGGFRDGKGEFYGEEMFRGKKVKLKFLWTSITETNAKWEQAYYDEEKDEWETNWVMEFTCAE